MANLTAGPLVLSRAYDGKREGLTAHKACQMAAKSSMGSAIRC